LQTREENFNKSYFPSRT